jgi:hypothetical protein
MDHDGDYEDRPGPSSRRREAFTLIPEDEELDIAEALPSASDHRAQHSRHSSVRSMQDDSQFHGSYRDDDHQQPDSPKQLSPTQKRMPGAISTVSSMVRRMTTMKSPLTGTRFRSVRRQQRYEKMDDDDEAGQGPVDLSSLEGLGFELNDMQPGPSNQRDLDEEETEYVSPATTRSAKPKFREFVDKRRSVQDGIGEGMNQIGAQLRRNPTKAPKRTPAARDDAANQLERHKTVRNIGQKLASEKNTIVEVNESVIDLSQFEGPASIPFRQSTASFDQLLSGNRVSTFGSITAQEEHKSYFFPQDPDVPNWKPFPMKTFYILVLIVMALAIAGVQEGLCQMSIRKTREEGGLIVFNNVKSVPTMKFFAWKCKSPRVPGKHELTDARSTHDHCRGIFSVLHADGLRDQAFGTILSAITVYRSHSGNESQLRSFDDVSVFCAVQGLEIEAMGSPSVHHWQHNCFYDRSGGTESLSSIHRKSGPKLPGREHCQWTMWRH